MSVQLQPQPQQQVLEFAAPQPVIVARAAGQIVSAAASSAAPSPAATELWAAVQFEPGPDSLTPGERDAHRRELIDLARRFTPRVSFEPPDALLFELAGSCRLFGGLRSLLQQLRAVFPLPFAVALAPLPLAALVFARAGRARCLTNAARLSSRLAPLPVALLRWPDDELQRLRSMGVGTFGELLRLPREGLARRLGPARLDELDRLMGRRADPRVSVPAEERFTARVDPGFETTDTERLLGALAPALESLEDFLRVRQRGVLALRLTFAHRRCLPTMFVLRLVVPEYRAARFNALLAARFESLSLPGPVRHVDLAAGKLRRLPGDSAALWQPGEHGGDARAQAPEFLQSLMARLGERSVYGLALVPGHRPERQSRSVWPRLDASVPADPLRPDYRSRPLGLLSPPQPLEACADGQGRIRCLLHQGQALHLVTGPERIETGWWDGGDIARDYYVARADEGALWWVFRECDEARRWYVHGCFA